MALIAWTEIEGFSNIRKYTLAHPEILNEQSKVTYKAKVKLHGMNHAVQVHEDGKVIAQSRTTELSVSKDNEGFAKWVDSCNDGWSVINNNTTLTGGWVVYGEWVGPGIQKGVALTSLPKKVFAVFAAKPLGLDDGLIIEPDFLKTLVKSVSDAYVIPWYSCPVKGHTIVDTVVTEDANLIVQMDIDWNYPDGQLQLITTQINEWVAEVEACDPWVKTNFGISGTGEGLVFYPVSKEHTGYANFCNLTFKAKGEAHKNIATAKPAQVNAEAAASVDAFVSMVLTEARLEQGAQAVQVIICRDGSPLYNPKHTGEFVKWISADVQKETQDELEASKLTWAQVQKPLSEKARQWYLRKAKP